MSNLIADLIIGDDLLQQHKSVTFEFPGEKKEFYISTNMPTARVPYRDLFRNITRNCKPIAIKTKKFLTSDQPLIKTETDRLLNENRIEKSNSPWRAQPLVVDNGKEKRKMCIDYSRIINLFKNYMPTHYQVSNPLLTKLPNGNVLAL